ncbi:hypothetical protein H7K45_12090 [Mycobacterium yunnanensis]|uniref:Uncharacterized protein n=1 Tax=Mycobacterium yunnanensis TaxID=368477 RepID=A0A9X3C1C8_9MYCO|nr:hypothetical protein [Mycobacterium yunnanensis]MCV7421283.1 hypothetical protein [Mycobacterium yunnanensis]
MTASPSERLHEAFEASRLTVPELWLRYFALGGQASELELDAYIGGALALPAFEHDVLAHAINERLDEIGPPRAPYSDAFTSLGFQEDQACDEGWGGA